MAPFWLRPKWVAGHVVCLALVVLFVNLGFWQLRRLETRRERNDTIEARSAEPIARLEEVVGAGSPIEVGDQVSFRRVVASGRYDGDGEVLIRNVSQGGRPGVFVLTPLVLDDGAAVLVNRGFVPAGGDTDGIRATVVPPTEDVDVTGLLQPSQERGNDGAREEGGRILELARGDVERIQGAYDRELYPVVLQLEARDPPAADPPTPLPAPSLSEGSHRSYAFQWWAFAVVGLVGWPILLKRTADERRKLDRPDPLEEAFA